MIASIRDRVFLGQLAFQKALERVEVDRFELAKALHPDAGAFHRARFQLAPDHPAAPFLADQTGAAQHTQMFGNRGQRHLERLGHIGDGHVIFQKHRQDAPPRGVCQRREDGIEGNIAFHALSRKRPGPLASRLGLPFFCAFYVLTGALPAPRERQGHNVEKEKSLNVLGERLVPCSFDPVTGFFRDGACNTCSGG